jgi:hypothetical protein
VIDAARETDIRALHAPEESRDLRIDTAEIQRLVEIDLQVAPDHFFQETLCIRMGQNVVVQQYELSPAPGYEIVKIADLADASLLGRHKAETATKRASAG